MKFSKLLFFFLGFFLLGAVSFFAFDFFARRQSFVFVEDPWSTLETPEEAYEYFQALDKVRRNDPYGGETPEETLNLFTEALEKGDLELASKYLLIEEQKKGLEILQKGMISGGTETLLNILKGDKVSSRIDPDYYRFDFLGDDRTRSIHSIDLILIESTGKWKILEL